jgi:hypothetical protein
MDVAELYYVEKIVQIHIIENRIIYEARIWFNFGLLLTILKRFVILYLKQYVLWVNTAWKIKLTKVVPLYAMKALGGRGSIAPAHSRPRH